MTKKAATPPQPGTKPAKPKARAIQPKQPESPPEPGVNASGAEAKPRRGRGQPPHVPDKASRQRVLAWSGGGISQDLIAESLNIDRNTLAKHYKSELAVGKAMMDGLAISTLALAMQRGGKEGVVAAKWWTQSRMGWTERLVVDDGKPGDTPMRVIIELVGEAPTVDHRPARPRSGFDPSLVQLIG